VARQRLRDVFGFYHTETELDCWHLRYNKANSRDIYLMAHDTDASMVHGFTVHRLCADHRLWDALASILALGDVVLYFTGVRAPFVARSTVTQHLSPEMVDSLGQPKVVITGREIQNEIYMA
jgi:hypothetical protein